MLLPVVMKFNGDVCADRFAEILEALSVSTKGMTKKQKIDKFVSMIEELSASVKVTQTIKDYGCKMEDIDMLSNKAMEDPCMPGNPKDVTKEDFVKLYTEAMKR